MLCREAVSASLARYCRRVASLLLIGNHFAAPGHLVTKSPNVEGGLVECDAVGPGMAGHTRTHEDALTEMDHVLRDEPNRSHSSSQRLTPRTNSSRPS